jgi:hypothetical protein
MGIILYEFIWYIGIYIYDYRDLEWLLLISMAVNLGGWSCFDGFQSLWLVLKLCPIRIWCSLPWCKATQKSSFGTPFASSDWSLAGWEQIWCLAMDVTGITMTTYHSYYNAYCTVVQYYNLYTICTILPATSGRSWCRGIKLGVRKIGGDWEIPFQGVSNFKRYTEDKHT